MANIVYLDGSVIFFNLLVPVLAIAAGCGLVRFKGWGWRWALIVSFIMLSANVIKAISFVFIEYLTKNLPMQELPDGIPVVSVINVWPPYIYAALSLLLIIVLIRPAIKKEFSEKGE
ncbi:MAG TPA: hypothetical protein ENG95_00800 [Nitrospirae bacterium]|nr:hypothetical protein [Nitrospirota bacterium]HDO25165.1 hypothetical protein [Nitrospirota bacterium]